MPTITILGAGYMGSALTFPAADNGHRVRLWGTWLDNELIQAVQEGKEHPRLQTHLPQGVETFYANGLAEALKDADLVINAVTSEGIVPVMTHAFPLMPEGALFASVSKGFWDGPGGNIQRLSVIVSPLSPSPNFRYLHVAGPSKALELCRRVPTAVHYACEDISVAERVAELMRTPYYRIRPVSDLAGCEVCSALKNAYAIAIGLFDGLEKAGRLSQSYNTKSAAFTKAVREMAVVVEALGGQPDTVFGLPGIGDLLVTAVAGRNRTFGELLGMGQMSAAEVVEYMSARDQLTEGYPAIRTGWYLVQRLAQRGKVRLESFALLKALYAMAYEDAPVWETLRSFQWSETERRKGTTPTPD